MNLFLMNWAMFIFLVGLLLSLPLGAVYYLKGSPMNQFFTNPRKLKAAHLDYIMQSFSLGLVYLLEMVTNTSFPIYAVIPLAFGTFCNPFIFLLEATPLYKEGLTKILYRTLKAASPSALFFAWFTIAIQSLPVYIFWLLAGFVIVFVIAYMNHVRKTKHMAENKAASVRSL